SSGKIQRRACRDAFLSERLQGVADDTLAEVAPHEQEQERLTRWSLLAMAPTQRQEALPAYLITRIGSVPRLDLTREDISAPISGFGLDSLKAAELRNALEEDLEVAIPFIDFLQEKSVANLAASILTQLAEQSTSRPEYALTRAEE